QSNHDLSLYVHVPFCEKLCKFCACNRVIMRKGSHGASELVERYLSALEREIRGLAASFDGSRALRQIHWGGGSPTYLTGGQIERIQRVITESFNLSGEAEVAMEVDPRHVTPQELESIRRIGFTRVSLGVQDFDVQVQEHIHRVQPFEMVRDVVTTCRDLAFESINFDLIYGMPYQTPRTIRDTVEKSIALSPDRVAYYHYAQIPEKIATQRGMDNTRLPDSETKLEMFLTGLECFRAAGYEFIGLDHFAKPDEALSQSLNDGTLQRNFQGMTTGGDLRLLGVGASSISHLPDVGFVQNVKGTEQYIACLENGESPVERGIRLSFDDRVRGAVISQLYCTAEIRPWIIEKRLGISFGEHFSREVRILKELERDGLVTLSDRLDQQAGSPGRSHNAIRATWPLGRVLLRNIAAVFDAYLDPEAYRKGEQHCFSANA
ncbi:MAG: oxygen-independent coproporphyrinogen III oxidase, partial [Phycisphaerae bacterium]